MNKRFSRVLALLLTVVMAAALAAPAFAETPVYYQSAYASKAEALAAGLALNEQIAAEGMILLKNEDAALPLAKGAKVTLLGYAAIAPNAGASMNGGDASAGAAIAQANVISSLQDNGFELNPVVLDAYTAWAAEAVPGTENEEKPTMKAADYQMADDLTAAWETEEWKASFAEYADAALVVIGKSTCPDIIHSLQLDAAQLALIDCAAASFAKVIVLVNSCTPIEMAAVQNNDAVDAILNIGEPGDNGFQVLGAVLNGDITPSGRTVDTWAVDFTQNPSYVNFNTTGSAIAQGVDGAGTATGYTRYSVDGEAKNTWSVGYEEGIYVGYRYYETRGAVEGEEWYAENVVYPFGYGLSYTDFDWAVSSENGPAITKDDTLTYDITVTNVGSLPGAEVVELYFTAPYGTEATGNPTVIEKSEVVLAGFAKTGVLQPGESETVQIALDVKDMASYDDVTDRTYVLDAGEYIVHIATDAHCSEEAAFTYTVAEKALCNEAPTGAVITNQMDDVTEGFASEGYTALSRADFAGTMPDGFVAEKAITAEEYATWAYDDAAFNAYYDAAAIGTPVVAEEGSRTEDKYAVQLADLIGAPADDPRFQELVEQMTLQELIDMVNYGGFNSRGNDYIGKPYSRDTDGPKGWTGNYTDSNDRFNYFSSEPMIAATWNTDLLYQMGQIIGEQGIWGNSTVASGKVFSYTGWYAPGMNIHRSPFDGRVTEYYSEDPFITGAMAAAVCQGAQSKGCYITLKHFAFHNDGSGAMTYRFGPIGGKGAGGTAMDGLSVWCSEQAAREIYLKGYQMAVEDGNATFAMGSFTRIGKTWCSGSYAINQAITRNEWGFDGAIVTDIVLYRACDAYQLVKSGANMMLDALVYGLAGGIYIDAETINAMPEADRNITIYAMQESVKQILYMVANSNAMQIPMGAKVVYTNIVEIDDEEVEIELAEAKAGEAYTSQDLATASLNTYYAYAPIVYSASGLPEGMILEGGVITGTPAAAGEYTVVITAEAEGYAPASIELALKVA